jgi:hypothetical protein
LLVHAGGRHHAPHVDLQQAFADFVDYWRKQPGRRGRKLDLEAALRDRLGEQEADAVLEVREEDG